MTIKEIAEICGVSRGTVDRVLNHRGHVKPDTEERVRAVAERLGYTPNYAARMLAVRKKSPVIGVIIFTQKNPFIFDVITGIKKAAEELQYIGVTIELRMMQHYNEQEQLELIDELAPKISALILLPISTPAVRERIAALYAEGIPTFTVASDIDHSKRVCYIGSDYRKGGLLAAGIIRLFAPVNASVGIVAGVEDLPSHRQRLEGFMDRLTQTRPDLTIADVVYSQDDDICAYEGTTQMLQKHPEISIIQTLAGGVEGAYRAIQNCPQPLSVVAFDQTRSTTEMLKKGIAKAVICQHPIEQGFQAFQIACEYIINGAFSGTENNFIENELLLLENIE